MCDIYPRKLGKTVEDIDDDLGWKPNLTWDKKGGGRKTG